MISDDFFHREYQLASIEFFLRELLARAARSDPEFLDQVSARIETFEVAPKSAADRSSDALMWRIYSQMRSTVQSVRE